MPGGFDHPSPMFNPHGTCFVTLASLYSGERISSKWVITCQRPHAGEGQCQDWNLQAPTALWWRGWGLPLKDKFALSSSSHITWCHCSLSGAAIPFDRPGIETQRGHTSRPRVTHGVYGILMSLPLFLPPSGKLVMVVI